MASKKQREREEERARHEREERIALLKMKQGIIEESDVIPETGYVEIPELHGWAKLANFFYHNKIYILLIAFAAVVVGICTFQIVTKEREDLYILVVSYTKNTELAWRTEDIEKALEMYCPDFDGNGKIHVGVNYIDRTQDTNNPQYELANAQKLTAELTSADAQLIISDEGFADWVTEGDPIDTFFLNFKDSLPEDKLYKECGIRIGKTDFAEAAQWKKCPDNILLFVREELNNGSGSVKTNARNRERAMELVQNIIDGNIINPIESDE